MSDLIVLTDRGLYCEAGDFYIDAWKPVHRSFVTHGHGDHAHQGMGEYWCATSCADILKWRLGAQKILTMDYGAQRIFGGVTVSLHPAGHILGSAQIRVQKDDEVWVFTGDFKRQPDPTCAPFEIVRCDVFICEATFAFPIYVWPSMAVEIGRLLQWVKHCQQLNKAALLYAYSLGKAQRILAELDGKLNAPVLLHGAMAKGVEVYRRAAVPMAATQMVMDMPVGTNFAGRLVLAPPSAKDSTWTKRFGDFEQAKVSGWMQLRGNRRRNNVQRGFVISDHADWQDLLRTIRESGARRVLATHGNTDALIPYLEQEMGLQAQRLRTVYGDEEDIGEAEGASP